MTKTKNALLINESIKSSLFATVLVFQSNIKGIKSILEKIPVKFILFPLLAITEVITTLFNFYHFIKAKNKNLGKTFDFLFSLLTTTLILTAIVGSLSLLLSPASIASLFIAAISMGAIYNIGQFFYHAYQWLTTPSGSKTRLFFRDQTIKYGITGLIGAIVTTGLVFTLMLPMATPVLIAVAGITATLAVVTGACYQLYKHYHPSTSAEAIFEDAMTNRPRYYGCQYSINKDASLDNFFQVHQAYLEALKKDIKATRKNFFGKLCYKIFGFYPQEKKRMAKQVDTEKRIDIFEKLITEFREIEKAMNIKVKEYDETILEMRRVKENEAHIKICREFDLDKGQQQTSLTENRSTATIMKERDDELLKLTKKWGCIKQKSISELQDNTINQQSFFQNKSTNALLHDKLEEKLEAWHAPLWPMPTT